MTLILSLTLLCVTSGIVIVVVDVDIDNETDNSCHESFEEFEEELEIYENIYEKIKQIVAPREKTDSSDLNKKASTSIASNIASSIAGISLNSSSLPIPIPCRKAFE
jgi:GTPase involved in cell partitioning and DNA repair